MAWTKNTMFLSKLSKFVHWAIVRQKVPHCRRITVFAQQAFEIIGLFFHFFSLAILHLQTLHLHLKIFLYKKSIL